MTECAYAVEEGIVVAKGAIVRVRYGGTFDTGLVDPNISRTQVTSNVVECVGAGLTNFAVKKESVAFGTYCLVGRL